ncbi:cyclopropane fatty acyl phospholipid synthase [Photobacterium carnosum]|uniref:cyclopropane fatty acyl phospholipid synthase n=1 Tax=Photobacterium carnosum TaxID=2023717 RepID=UPI001E434FEF|nr:cyclopropane fatty acyl phospholipid synthase [Photobacterium carnosum]MCD9537745.1 cyclopropane fatty acyl phospholipid synthase [Photobacterium carnosum]MCF2162291.1 cyclopropane fatty acyl phospholipid synthase [Photobacterium carnosum]
MTNEKFFENLLSHADVIINGSRPWDLHVHDERLYDRVLTDGSLGFGESYMDGWWSCDAIDEMINRILHARIDEKLDLSTKLAVGLKIGASKVKHLFNHQSIDRVTKDVPFHYDLGNDLFESMLDKRMTYTCGYWKDAIDLDSAQEAKLDLVCRKMGLKSGMRLLDIGCGWGSFMNYAAEHYGVICDGLTLSKEQAALGQQRADDLNLPVRFIVQDYRLHKPERPYDRVVSIGMMEHVGPDNYPDYFQAAYRYLAEDGIFLLHTIGSPDSKTETDAWINKYIFPNGVVPSMTQIGSAAEDYFNIEDVQNIGPDYDKTLVAWNEKFEQNWPEISERYGEKFYRMWRYYLLSCAGAFRCRDLNVWQFGLTKKGAELPLCVRSN